MPELKKVYGSYKGQGLVLIGIHSDKDVAKRDQCVKENKLPYPICEDKDMATLKAYHVEFYPTVIVIDRKGFIRAVEPPNLDKAVKEALAAK
ncbi:redoxin domain-containing protein [Fimbriimonas ginsengisoli Gsoil 348]|uniref:Redoxin domain-containing protein n=1 Tax=Fimbriimonas ginsengisoli Gsoil 348 TaxID=661478 RepID=A0A068NV81_FIMGI|nr:redoxin domain-containing protein [Fimbriimonas ginsengisoli Gsoil 348]